MTSVGVEDMRVATLILRCKGIFSRSLCVEIKPPMLCLVTLPVGCFRIFHAVPVKEFGVKERFFTSFYYFCDKGGVGTILYM